VKYVYPAIFTPEKEGGFCVLFPNLPGCVTCGDTIADAIEMGRDALAMWLCDAEDKHEIVPQTSKLADIIFDKGSFVNLIDADTVEYRRENDNQAVKKTLSIPSWLNAQGEKAGVNFSQILQDALKSRLGLESHSVKRHPATQITYSDASLAGISPSMLNYHAMEVVAMPTGKKGTGKKAGSDAGTLLSKPSTSKTVKTVAASDLSQVAHPKKKK
jgi:predicted RNase H-like HicB family nuclease